MENRLKRKLADVQYLLRGARTDIERMKTLPVPRR
jgi:hypothetical protein